VVVDRPFGDRGHTVGMRMAMCGEGGAVEGWEEVRVHVDSAGKGHCGGGHWGGEEGDENEAEEG
jgi:hypothetical protein